MSDAPATDRLSTWLRSLLLETCAAGKLLPDALADRLGVALVPGYRGYAEVAPLPEGVLQIVFGLETDRGPVRFVEVQFESWAAVPLADLAPVLVDGREQPPRHVGDLEQWHYSLESAAADRCTIAVDLAPGPAGSPRLVRALTVIP